jgi:hypothetical protein
MWIFLDDERKDATIVHNQKRGLGIGVGKANNWVIARNFNQFVDLIKNNFNDIDFISFDHDISSYDLNGKELTGKDAAEFLTNYCMDNNKKLPNWFVHSDNNNGNKNIRQWLFNYMFRVEGRLDKMVDAYGYVNGTLIYNI